METLLWLTKEFIYILTKIILLFYSGTVGPNVIMLHAVLLPLDNVLLLEILMIF